MEKLALKIPFLYTLYSRGGVFSVINNYIYGPTFIVAYAIFFSELPNIFQVLSVIAVSYVLFALVYEIGYLINDLVAVKFEVNPTLRLSDKYTNKQVAAYLSVRFIMVGFIYAVIMIFDFTTNFFVNVYAPLLVLLFMVYVAHNFIHLLDMSLRIVTFTLLKMSFWSLPALYVFLQLPNTTQNLFVLLFIGAYSFYFYSYSLNKKWIGNWLEVWLPKDLEQKLLIFFGVVFILIIPLKLPGYDTFIAFVCLYVLVFWLLRRIGRLIVK